MAILATFVQLSARLKNFLGGWLLVLGIKEGLVECATVCVKSVVILMCFLTRRVRTRNFTVHRAWRGIQGNPKFLQSIGSNYKLYGDEPQLGVNEFITAR